MLKSIRKHPAAFAHSLAWIVFGLCVGYAVYHQNLPMEHVPLSLVVLCAAGISLFVMGITLLVAIIAKLARKKNAPEDAEQRFLDKTAKRYIFSTPSGNKIALRLLFACLLPFACFLIIGFTAEKVGSWISALLFIGMGVSIWIFCTVGDLPGRLLLQKSPEESCFRMQNSIPAELPDRLAANPPTLGIAQSLWEKRSYYLHNMLIKEGLIDENAVIHCYVIPMDTLRSHWNLPPQTLGDAQVVWVPLRPVLQGGTSKVGAIKSLFQYNLTDIARMQYTTFRANDPADYAFTSHSLRFQLHEDASICFEGDRLQLFCPSADDGEPESDQIYLGCMMEAAGAAPVRVKYDCFSTWDDEDDSTETDLSREEMQAFLGLLQKGGFDCVVNMVSYHEKENLFALEIWGNPTERNHPLFSEEEQGYLLVLRYQKLTACWMATENMD